MSGRSLMPAKNYYEIQRMFSSQMEVKITNDNVEFIAVLVGSSFFKRFLFAGKFYFGFFSAGLLAILVIKGYSIYYLLTYILLLFIFGIYSLFVAARVLHEIRYSKKSRTIEISIERFNEIIVLFTGKQEDIEILVREDFGNRYPVWLIYFYRKREVIYSQRELNGWTKEIFSEIKKAIEENEPE